MCLVLTWFKTGVTPDVEEARLVLAHVVVATWSDCSEEAAFLEAELLERLETGSDNDIDHMLIVGLMAFLLYCHGVLFDSIIDYSKANKATTQGRIHRYGELWRSSSLPVGDPICLGAL